MGPSGKRRENREARRTDGTRRPPDAVCDLGSLGFACAVGGNRAVVRARSSRASEAGCPDAIVAHRPPRSQDARGAQMRVYYRSTDVVITDEVFAIRNPVDMRFRL